MEKAAKRGFGDAIEALNSLITKPRGGDVHGDREQWNANLKLVSEHLRLLELEAPLAELSVIHVAGTKGKGSTCAFVERILRASGYRTALFTSPHLLDIRERFKLNGEDVSEELFTKHFWWCWDHLQVCMANSVYTGLPMPRLFRFLTILAIKIFTSQKVDVAILEVGLGGTYDATNIVKAPAVCGIASLGFDHMELLGNTLGEIASQKAGIFKAGVPAVTVPQIDEAMEALEKRASELGISLEIALPLEAYGLGNLQLGLKGEHQRVNASLAVAICRRWAERSGHSEHSQLVEEAVQRGSLPDSYVKGLAETEWAGRAQVIQDTCNGNNIQFYLDGAHSPESMEACARWFVSAAKSDISETQPSAFELKQHVPSLSCKQILLFNCMSKRDPRLLLPPLIDICNQQGFPFHLACFVPPYSSHTAINSYEAENEPDLSWQKVLQQHWEGLRSSSSHRCLRENGKVNTELLSSLKNGCDGLDSARYKSCHFGVSSVVLPSLPAALNWLRSCSNQHPSLRFQVLVTGSLYLVADVLRLLKR